VKIEGKPIILYPKRKFSLLQLLIREITSAVVENLSEKGVQLNFRIFPASTLH